MVVVLRALVEMEVIDNGSDLLCCSGDVYFKSDKLMVNLLLLIVVTGEEVSGSVLEMDISLVFFLILLAVSYLLLQVVVLRFYSSRRLCP